MTTIDGYPACLCAKCGELFKRRAGKSRKECLKCAWKRTKAARDAVEENRRQAELAGRESFCVRCGARWKIPAGQRLCGSSAVCGR